MKKIILATYFVLIALMGMAQNVTIDTSIYLVDPNTHFVDSSRYLVSKLSQNWFFTITGSANWWQGSDRIPTGDFTSLNRTSFGGGVSVGKWITHNIALRLAYDVNQAHSYINGGHDNLGHLQFLYDDKTQPIAVTDPQDNTLLINYYKTSFMYHNVHGDVLISPLDLIQGKYQDRPYTPLIVAGMGLGMVSEHPFVLQSVFNNEAINYELSYNVGLMNNFFINSYLDLSLSLMLTGQRWTIDSWTYEYNGPATTNNGGTTNIRPKRADHNYSSSLGIIYYPTRRQYDYPMNYLIERKELHNRIKELELALANQGESPDTITTTDTVKVERIVSAPLSIFFHRDKYQLMSNRDKINLREIANIANKYGCYIKLIGSCDSATATVPYNQTLSQNRCNTIRRILVDEMGVDPDKIIDNPIGGVKILDPTEYDRRVQIYLFK